MDRHTEGPFGVSSSVMACDQRGKIVANCLPTGIESLDVPYEEAAANATLFAAAPDLLAACKDALFEFQGVLDHVVGFDEGGRRTKTTTEQMLEAAIAKAEGGDE